nr:replication initiator protein A [uncultured Tyzzerella sp.]
MLDLKVLANEKFYKLHKFLFEDERFEKLTIEGKVLYSLILERYKLSVERERKDENGYYVIFRITEIQKILNCGNQKAGKILNELELVGLIDKRKQGSSNPDLIYLKNLNFKVKCENQKFESHTTNDVKCENQKCENHIYNKTNINKTNIKTDISKINIQSGALAPDNKGGVKITPQEQIYKIPLKNGDYYILYHEQVEIYKSLYPNINIEQELRNIIGWNMANVNKRKSLKGIKKHINLWLQKSNATALEKIENFNQKENRENVIYRPNYSTDDFFNI